MHIAPQARAASIAVLAAILLTSCSAATPTSDGVDNAPEPTSTSAPAGDARSGISFEDRIAGDETGVAVLEVIDPVTFLVGPDAYEQRLYDLTGEAEVGLRDNLIAPEQGDCGYDEALAYATDYFAEDPEGGWVARGAYGNDSYYQDVVRAGFAYLLEPGQQLENAQTEARGVERGLWGTCDGWGDDAPLDEYGQ